MKWKWVDAYKGGRSKRETCIQIGGGEEMGVKITVVTGRMRKEERHSQQRGRFKGKANMEMLALQE